MSIIFNSKNHDKVYFNGKYHDKIYHGSTLVWQKGTPTDPPAEPTNLYSTSVTDIQALLKTTNPNLFAASTALTTYFPCEPNTTYTITMKRYLHFVVASFAGAVIIGNPWTDMLKHPNEGKVSTIVETLTYTTSSTACYVGIYYFVQGYGDANEIRNSIVVTKV